MKDFIKAITEDPAEIIITAMQYVEEEDGDEVQQLLIDLCTVCFCRGMAQCRELHKMCGSELQEAVAEAMDAIKMKS